MHVTSKVDQKITPSRILPLNLGVPNATSTRNYRTIRGNLPPHSNPSDRKRHILWYKVRDCASYFFLVLIPSLSPAWLCLFLREGFLLQKDMAHCFQSGRTAKQPIPVWSRHFLRFMPTAHCFCPLQTCLHGIKCRKPSSKIVARYAYLTYTPRICLISPW